jgi:hypothetical protein
VLNWLYTGHTGVGGKVFFNRASDGTNQAFVGYSTTNSSSELQLWSGGGGSYLTLATAGGERMRIDNAGLVGIGTTTPTTALEVSGTVSATRFVGNGSGLTGISATGDRIVSGSVSAVAEQTSGTVRVSGTPAMVNTGQEVCGPATYNSFRINPVTHFMELCVGHKRKHPARSGVLRYPNIACHQVREVRCRR